MAGEPEHVFDLLIRGGTVYDGSGGEGTRADLGIAGARIAAVRLVLPPGVRLHYAIKANPMAALVGFLCPLVDGMDVASAGEHKLALDAGADKEAA